MTILEELNFFVFEMSMSLSFLSTTQWGFIVFSILVFGGMILVIAPKSKGGNLKYSTVLNWLHYAKSTSIRPVRPVAVDDFLHSITSTDIKKIKLFIPVLQQVSTNPDSPFYRYTIMRNFFRVYFENKVPDAQMIELGQALLKSTKVTDLADKRDTFAMRGIYHYIIDIAAPKVGLSLAKGDVKK